MTGILPYLLSLTPANDLQATFDAITEHEQTLVEPLLAFLTHPTQRSRGVLIVGSEQGGITRVPTVSFVVRGQRHIDSKELVRMVNRKGGVSGFTLPEINIRRSLLTWHSRSVSDGTRIPCPVEIQ